MPKSSTSTNKAISRANNVVKSYILNGSSGIEFTPSGKRSVVFKGFDEVTGFEIGGHYILNKKNIVDKYSSFIYREDVGGLLIDILLDGRRNSFVNHASAQDYLSRTNDPTISSAYVNAFSGYGQSLANFLDQLPGADQLNPISTYISLSATGQSWTA